MRNVDAVVVGSGPNGLAAAITMARAGLSVHLIEGADETGGGLRTAELTLPGFHHDVFSAVHPLGAASPFYSTLPLADHGLEWIEPPLAVAHPFDDRPPALLARDIDVMRPSLAGDADAYWALVQSIVENWKEFAPDALAPIHIPDHPVMLARFGLSGLLSVRRLVKASLNTQEARGLIAGIGAHAMRPLSSATTAAISLVLAAAAHKVGWPIAKGGSTSFARALTSYFVAIGGTVETGRRITSLSELSGARTMVLDMTPRQLLDLGGTEWSSIYQRSLEHFKYGPGVFKMDWALSEPVPWLYADCRKAGTLHLGGTFEEIARSESDVRDGTHSDRPYVLSSQPTVFDPSRAPAGKHIFWAYCHVPSGSTRDMTSVIEAQIERFAPGFRDIILERHTLNSEQLHALNPNIVGGDISQGANTLGQLFFRPAMRWDPYKTSMDGVYLCSASTPPGGGVHGMCGYHAARSALKREFGIDRPPV